jgi:hypothetical protein
MPVVPSKTRRHDLQHLLVVKASLHRVYPPNFQGDISTQKNFRIHVWSISDYSAKADKKARQYKRASMGTKGIYW